jgi:hypothetical protein
LRQRLAADELIVGLGLDAPDAPTFRIAIRGGKVASEMDLAAL